MSTDAEVGYAGAMCVCIIHSLFGTGNPFVLGPSMQSSTSASNVNVLMGVRRLVWWALLGTSVWANRPSAPAPTPLDIQGLERQWDVDVKEEHKAEQDLQAVQTRAGDREQKAAAVAEFDAREGAANVLVDSGNLKNILTEYRISNLYSQLSALGAHYPDDLVDMDAASISKLQAKPLEIVRLNRLLAKLKPVDAAVEADWDSGNATSTSAKSLPSPVEDAMRGEVGVVLVFSPTLLFSQFNSTQTCFSWSRPGTTLGRKGVWMQ